MDERSRNCSHRSERAIGWSRPGWTPRGLADAEDRQLGPINELDFDLGDLVETQDRIACLVDADDGFPRVAYGFFQRPARGLDDATFDLITAAIGRGDLPSLHC